MIPGPYSLSNLKKAIKQPHLFRYEATRLSWGLVNGYKHGEGVDVMSKDWDNLFILDACRCDYFRDINCLEGDLSCVTSKGKSSWGFLNHNFLGRDLHDTVYVTANPFFHNLSQDVFYTIRTTLENPADGGAGREVGISQVHPQRVLSLAKETHEEFPNKRLIVHFLQPHQPFLGEKADRVREQFTEAMTENRPERKPDHIPHRLVDEGLITVSDYREMYRDTLEYVLEYVEDLYEVLDGRSVITADHGELLGERYFGKRRWGHKYRYDCNETRRVPWFVLPSESCREIREDEPIGYNELPSEGIDEHLKALGYR